MSRWSSQLYKNNALAAGGDSTVVQNAVEIGRLIQQATPNATPVFTLRHFSHLTDISYKFLRAVVEREEPEPYRLFRVQKRQKDPADKPRFRVICVPDERLMRGQRWINQNILAHSTVHESSVAFGKGDSIIKAARLHCKCKWIIKLDILNFFESVSEQKIFHVFQLLGYQNLVAFELARLCTRKGQTSFARAGSRWKARAGTHPTIETYHSSLLGHLPQGAPTSPMLANLAMLNLDKEISKIADSRNLVYTRYADDMTFSTDNDQFSRDDALNVITAIYRKLHKFGLQPNLSKTTIVPPGGRKIVLGLLVDGSIPRLPKEFRANLRRHLYYLKNPSHGPVKHAQEIGSRSVYGLKNHIGGLIAHASQVDRDYAQLLWAEFNEVSWP